MDRERRILVARNTLITAVVFLVLFSLFLPRDRYHGRTWVFDAPEVDFAEYPAGEERKQAFLEYFLPIVVKENNKLLKARKVLAEVRQSPDRPKRQERWVKRVAMVYGLDTFNIDNPEDWDELLNHVDVIPVSLALAQAANESAWGTSRFARQGNNFFGQWCFKEGCGLVPKSRPKGAKHEVAVFRSPRHSVEKYMLNINSFPSYQGLREMRRQLRQSGQVISGLKLADGLKSYSARGEEYITELKAMIRHNKLYKYDQ